jgi:hypothetical protein
VNTSQSDGRSIDHRDGLGATIAIVKITKLGLCELWASVKLAKSVLALAKRDASVRL